MGATKIINNSDGKAVEKVLALTNNKGVDVAIEKIGGGHMLLRSGQNTERY
ncbi:hypothetical protein [Nitrosospira sp. Nsp14]|uniref:hypothetical protein n=1 Tax=Nitrosospira sp. Nsp14 TaxID=1855333 RepID=UPI0035280CDB